MKYSSLFTGSLLLLFLAACSVDPPESVTAPAEKPEPLPYLYKPPSTAEAGLPVARLKKEALAEAFVARLGTKAPAGVVVMQQEKLVLEEYYHLDSTAVVCTGSLFPPYVGALLGGAYAEEQGIPHKVIPLHELYPPNQVAVSHMFKSPAPVINAEQQEELVKHLDVLVQSQTSTTQGMAAEELLFEPLQIDDYAWNNGSLCVHPHDILKMGSLWVRRGRWGNQQLLPAALVQRVLAPAYSKGVLPGHKAYGWQYFKLVAKGRKQPVLYWQSNEAHLFLLPEVEAVVLLQGPKSMMPEAWEWMQEFLIPSLAP